MKPSFLLVLGSSLLAACGSGGGTSGGGGAAGGGSSFSLGSLQSSFTDILNQVDQALTLDLADTIVGSPYGTIYGGPAMISQRYRHAMAQLRDGRVIVVGGRYDSALFGHYAHEDLLIYRPDTKQWLRGPYLGYGMDMPQVVALANNRLLIAGAGIVRIFDGDTDTLQELASGCGSSRKNASVYKSILLQDGRVALFDGSTDVVEVYDPLASDWGCISVLGSLQELRYAPDFTRLPDGRILVTSGYTKNAEIFDPTSGRSHRAAGELTEMRLSYGSSLLADGRVLLIGGYHDSAVVGTAEIFDPRDESFTRIPGELAVARYSPFLLPIASGANAGKILVVAGYTGSENALGIQSVEVFDPETLAFSTLPTTFSLYGYSAMSPLGNGRYLFAGGYYGTTDVLVYDTTNARALFLSASGGSGSYHFQLESGEADFDSRDNLLLVPLKEQNLSISVTDFLGHKVSRTLRVTL